MANTDAVLQGVKDYTLELLGTKSRDEAVDAADRAEAQAERAETAADNAEIGIRDDSVAKNHLTSGLRSEIDGKADQQAVADNIATAQRNFLLKLRKDPSQSSYWLPVDLPTSLQGSNELRVMLPAKSTWRLTAQGVAGTSLRGVRNGAAARTKPLEDDEFVAHWDADADDWLLFTFPNKTPEDGTEIEVSIFETDALKADADHTHTAADVGARPDTWTPTAQDVGARPADWVPTAAQVGARPDTWTPTAQDVGALPEGWSPTVEVTGDQWPTQGVPGVIYWQEEES